MKMNFKRHAVMVAGLTLALSASAQPAINGQIYFIGGAQLNGPMATATAFTSFFGPGDSNSPVVLAGTGDYAIVPTGTPAQFMPLIFSGPGASIAGLGGGNFELFHRGHQQPAALPTTPFWAFTTDDLICSFVITSITVANQTANLLNLEGAGLLRMTDHSDTTGNWTITDTGSGSCTLTFGFQVAAVPEPTVPALLLGMAATLVGFRTRRI